MKRIATLLMFSFIAVGAFSQTFAGVSWPGWENEPAGSTTPGYTENPYVNQLVVIPQAPEGVSPGLIVDAATFDMAWGLLGDENAMANLVSNGVAPDIYDMDTDATFGAAWKGVHDGSALYVMIKYFDTNAQLDAGTHNFEVEIQPTSHIRHEPSFVAAADSAAEWIVTYQNMAYARYVELGGGKAVFKDGTVSEYAASIGLQKSPFWPGYAVGAWGGNEHGLLGLATSTHFWDVTDGVIRAIMVMTFDGALGYPTDPTDLGGEYTAVNVGDTIAFDIKSRGFLGGAENDNKVEYQWNSLHDNAYCSNYYVGHLVLAHPPLEPGDLALAGVSWPGWENEPAGATTPGYVENPYDNQELDILQAPDSWSYDGITDATTFDATWDILGDENAMANLVSNGVAPDIYDMDTDMTFGAAWKGVHDASNFYVLIKYYDTNAQLDAETHNFEVEVQPTSPIRHENSFEAAADSAVEWQVAYQNMAYGRYVELGGGKAVFKDGTVSEYAASIGLQKSAFWPGYVVGAWGGNEHGLLGLATVTHFWDVTDGVIRAIMVMSFDGALGYPVDLEDLAGEYNAVAVGDMIAFDIKSRGFLGGAENDHKVEYQWNSENDNAYCSNYYVGRLTLSDTKIVIEGIEDRVASGVRVFVYNNMLNIRGVEISNVNIYSITGSLVKSVQNVSGQLDMGELTDGVYFIKLEGIPSGFKVVK